MTRVKRGYIAQRRRKKIRLFVSSFRGAHSRLTRTIAQQKIRALVSSHRDRDRQKRDFRRLWITRINAVIRERGVYYNYSQFIHECIRIYRSFNFCAYPNCWFSLCMAKRSIGMVLIPEYSDNKIKKNKIETVMNSIEFRLLDRIAQAATLERVRNSSLIERSCAEDERG